MIVLRPLLVPGEAPLPIAARPRTLLDMSVRPLIRGVVLVAMLSAALELPALRTSHRPPSPFAVPQRPEAGIESAPKDAMRVALVREASR